MEPEAGIMLVWPLAAMEAQALGWSQIQPAHLLCAILKFAEMDGADLERLGQTNENLGNLAQEHQDLKAHLDDPWGITVPEVSTRLRRALRRPGEACPEPVSYTHLRAHETVLDLVCRLLLEQKQNKHDEHLTTT